MANSKINNLECPHCGELNTLYVRNPNTFNKRVFNTQCFNSEKQAGCMKEFEVVIMIGIQTRMTEQQIKDEETSLIKKPTQKLVQLIEKV